jgi:hypothetical protein
VQDVLDEQYMELYAPWKLINDPIYGLISDNSSLSNAFQLILGYNVNQFLVDMNAATWKDIADVTGVFRSQ